MEIVLFINGQETADANQIAGIYYWKNNLNGKGYVGQTLRIRDRMQSYRRVKCKLQRLLYRAFAKYGIENFTCYKVMDCCPSKVALNYWETYWIKTLDTFGPNGYNLTSGGGSYTLSDSTKQKMSKSQKIAQVGRVVSEATKEKLRNANIGKKHSEETKQKMRGKRKPFGKMSDEHKRKVSEAKKALYAKRGYGCSEEQKQKLREKALLQWKNGRGHSNRLAA